MPVKTSKKLIEVALPLEAINLASAREKSIRHGHPSTLHLWWARRPLAAARAVIFAQMVDDPSAYVDILLAAPETRKAAEREWKKRRDAWAAKADDGERGPEFALADCAADIERQRLFNIIKELVQWENSNNEVVLQKARNEIWQSWRRACAENVDHLRAKELFNRHKLPAFHDPFAGGGALPLEAQRLGLEAYASDLNPVAALINKAMIEIPPKFAGKPPVNPESRAEESLDQRQWRGAQGLAEDVRYCGQWMRNEAEKRIGDLYPKIAITAEMAKERPDLMSRVGEKLTVTAWLWVRTVKSPNPAFAQVDVPLATTFMLSTKPGKEIYIEPVIEEDRYSFTVKVGKPKDTERARAGTKSARGSSFKCLLSGSPISGDYIKTEGCSGRMTTRLMAIVAGDELGRVYLAPSPDQELAASRAFPRWLPEGETPEQLTGGGAQANRYGLKTWASLFSQRQLLAMTTFTELVQEVHEVIKHEALAAGLIDDARPLRDGGTQAAAYADAVAVYMACAMGRAADYWNSNATWEPGGGFVAHAFRRQAIPMAWDFAESNPFSSASGNWESTCMDWVTRVVATFYSTNDGAATMAEAQKQAVSAGKLISTDPPYYDNIPYADLSDFFYVWMRRTLQSIFPELFSTLAVPKVEELVALPYRHSDGKSGAEAFFLDGMTQAMRRLVQLAHPAFPVTIYYAFKQAETESSEGTASTGWETFLDAVMVSGFAITGTWPMRTERGARSTGIGTNALASSIVLVCRPRAANARVVTRREFLNALNTELPVALANLQRGNIAPVDLAQAAIGPGMAVYTRYAQVLDAGGGRLSVRHALTLINQTLDEALAEQESDFDADSRWALAWFEQSGFAEGDYGVAETLSKAKNISVAGLSDGRGRILESKRGKVRLLKPEELPADWDPTTAPRLTAWEVVHHLIRALGAGGEGAAADLVARLGSPAETARELAYRLYTLCERKKRPAEALAYNGLVQSWPEIARLAREGGKQQPMQADLLDRV